MKSSILLLAISSALPTLALPTGILPRSPGTGNDPISPHQPAPGPHAGSAPPAPVADSPTLGTAASSGSISSIGGIGSPVITPPGVGIQHPKPKYQDGSQVGNVQTLEQQAAGVGGAIPDPGAGTNATPSPPGSAATSAGKPELPTHVKGESPKHKIPPKPAKSA